MGFVYPQEYNSGEELRCYAGLKYVVGQRRFQDTGNIFSSDSRFQALMLYIESKD